MNMMESVIKPTDDDIPPVIDQTAPRLVSINTKLYVVLLLSFVFNIIQGFWINSANKRAETNTELMFVKMFPNGTWDVEYRKSGNEVDFFPLTIDKLIHDYVKARYEVLPDSMRRNYGLALLFMSPGLGNKFVGNGDGQFNAPLKAKEFKERGLTELIKIRLVDHYDVSNGNFVRGNSDIYRTNVFIERTTENSEGQRQGDPVFEVIGLHWRVKSIKELEKLTAEELRANPIGVEIIRDDISLDISQ